MKRLTRAISTVAASALMLGVATHSAAAQNATNSLTLEVYNADAQSFHVNSTLVYGDNEAMVVDTGFTKADALRIGANVLDSGKALKTIFVSQADPDYYFGAETLLSLFPDAKLITTPAVREVIVDKLDAKMEFWAPKMGANAPTDPVIPEAYSSDTITLDGHRIEIRTSDGPLAHRPYLWIPSNRTILGNVSIFGNAHLWMADAQSDEMRREWAAQLEEMLALNPETVIPGHMKAGTQLNDKTITFSQQYLADFEAAKANSKDSAELIATMQEKYPEADFPMALEIGAKVHMGEMDW